MAAVKRAARAALRSLRDAAAGSLVGVRTRTKAVALTFDDVPDPVSTPILLDLLARRRARATFFMLGARAVREPDLVAQVAAAGHEIASHGWDHRSLPLLDGAAIAAQIARTREALGPACGPLFRPPYGHQTFRVWAHARRMGVVPTLWSGMAEDWSGDGADAIAARINAAIAPGAIVLLHDTLATCADPAFRSREATFAALERVLAARRDYAFITIAELRAMGAPVWRWWSRPADPAFLATLTEAPC